MRVGGRVGLQLGARIFVDGNNVMGSRPDRWWLDRHGAARRLLEQVAELARARQRPVDGGVRRPPAEAQRGVTPRRGRDRRVPGAPGPERRRQPHRPAAGAAASGLGCSALHVGPKPAGAGDSHGPEGGGRPRAAESAGGPTAASGQRNRGGDVDHTAQALGSAATPDDVPLILGFIRGIAEYERLTHQVEASEEGLRSTMFGGAPSAEALLGFVDDAPAGYAVYFHTYSTFLGRRGLYLETSTCRRSTAGRGWARC